MINAAIDLLLLLACAGIVALRFVGWPRPPQSLLPAGSAEHRTTISFWPTLAAVLGILIAAARLPRRPRRVAIRPCGRRAPHRRDRHPRRRHRPLGPPRLLAPPCPLTPRCHHHATARVGASGGRPPGGRPPPPPTRACAPLATCYTHVRTYILSPAPPLLPATDLPNQLQHRGFRHANHRHSPTTPLSTAPSRARAPFSASPHASPPSPLPSAPSVTSVLNFPFSAPTTPNPHEFTHEPPITTQKRKKAEMDRLANGRKPGNEQARRRTGVQVAPPDTVRPIRASLPPPLAQAAYNVCHLATAKVKCLRGRASIAPDEARMEAPMAEETAALTTETPVEGAQARTAQAQAASHAIAWRALPTFGDGIARIALALVLGLLTGILWTIGGHEPPSGLLAALGWAIVLGAPTLVALVASLALERDLRGEALRHARPIIITALVAFAAPLLAMALVITLLPDTFTLGVPILFSLALALGAGFALGAMRLWGMSRDARWLFIGLGVACLFGVTLTFITPAAFAPG